MLKSMLYFSFQIFKIPLYIVLFVLGLFVLSTVCFYLYGLIKGRRIRHGKHKKVKQSNILKKLFWEAPRAFVDDLFDKPPDFFPYQGLIIYTGRQGQGKTISMVRDMMLMQEEYPLCKCITNLAYKGENCALSDWKQLITYKNDIYGVIVGLDEIQNWFSSKQSKDFPPEMFEVVTQNRKNRRVILATTQNFYQPAKDIRAQCSEVRKCMTFFGVFTVVHAMRPVLDCNGDVKEWKHIRFYCFVHTKEIRESYDTYKVIESLMRSGFKERKQTGDVITNVNIVKRK